MRRSILLLALALFSFVSVSSQAEGKDDEALRSLVKKMADAQLAFDPAALDRILTPDYIEISPAGEFDTREKVLGFYRPAANPTGGPVMNVDVSDYSIRNYGRFAIVIAKLNFTATMNGKASPPRAMRATFVCRSEKGGWKIASAQYTGVRPPQPKQGPQ